MATYNSTPIISFHEWTYLENEPGNAVINKDITFLSSVPDNTFYAVMWAAMGSDSGAVSLSLKYTYGEITEFSNSSGSVASRTFTDSTYSIMADLTNGSNTAVVLRNTGNSIREDLRMVNANGDVCPWIHPGQSIKFGLTMDNIETTNETAAFKAILIKKVFP